MEEYAGRLKYLDMAERSGQLPTYKNTFLHTSGSDFAPEDTDFKSRFSRNVPLNVPLVSAAMDTVTEWQMAIAMALMGGIGVIHRNMPPEVQRKMIARCKHARNGFIPDPVCIPPEWTVRYLDEWRKAKEYNFKRFLVCEGGDPRGKLLGMVTGKDLQFCRDHSIQVSKIMTERNNLKVGPEGMTKKQAYAEMFKSRIESVPVRQADGSHGLFLFDDLQEIFEKKHPLANVDYNDRLRVAAAIGTGDDQIERAELLLREHVDAIVIDLAHVHSNYAERTVRAVSELARGKADVIAGNISNPGSAIAVDTWGVDGIKIGQGPSAICTTRVNTGTGAPQAWAVAACAEALRKMRSKTPICADGGIVQPGNVPVAIALGASSVMVGTLFAGTDEAPGKIVFDPKLGQAKKHRGMGSRAVMMSESGANRYGQEHLATDERLSEGVEGRVPYRGPVRLVFARLRGGLGKGMYNTGCQTIDKLCKHSWPYIASPEAVHEAQTHDVYVTDAS